MARPLITSKTVVAASDTTIDQLNDLIGQTLRKAGHTDRQLQTAVQRGGEFQKAFDAFFATFLSQVLTAFMVVVDYGLALSNMIAAGSYDYVNSDITAEHFPVEGSGTVEVDVHLLHFNRSMTSDSVLREMETQGFRPGTLPELLAFGATYREKQKEFRMIALGSVFERVGGRSVPYLGCWRGGRELDLLWFDAAWDDGCQFAAIRK